MIRVQCVRSLQTENDAQFVVAAVVSAMSAMPMSDITTNQQHINTTNHNKQIIITITIIICSYCQTVKQVVATVSPQ